MRAAAKSAGAAANAAGAARAMEVTVQGTFEAVRGSPRQHKLDPFTLTLPETARPEAFVAEAAATIAVEIAVEIAVSVVATSCVCSAPRAIVRSVGQWKMAERFVMDGSLVEGGALRGDGVDEENERGN